MPKIERNSPSVVSTPRAQAVTRTVTNPEVASTPKAADTAYAGQAAPPKDLVPKQQQLTRSADPSALWGEAPKAMELDPAAFAKLSPAEQKQALQSLRAERNQLAEEISHRLEKLDVKWNHSRLVTRTEALREYQEKTAHLEPATKQALDGLLDKSEASQRKINELRARIDRLPKTPEQKAKMKALRDELAKELRSARSEQSKVVKAATAVVDEQGLKADRLAVTEQVIDPSAPAQGSGGSLLDKIARFLKLDWFFSAIGVSSETVVTNFAQAIEQRGEQWKQEGAARLEQQKLRQRDDDERVAQVRAALSRRTA